MAEVALITGAAGGLGQALCRRFGESGYRVIGLDRVHGAAGCEAFVETDLEALCASQEGLANALERIRGSLSPTNNGGLAVLVNNAACQVLGPVEALSIADWHRSLCVNLCDAYQERGPFHRRRIIVAFKTGDYQARQIHRSHSGRR